MVNAKKMHAFHKVNKLSVSQIYKKKSDDFKIVVDKEISLISIEDVANLNLSNYLK